MPVTDFIETTEGLLDFAETQLKADTSWEVKKFPGTNYMELFEFLPALGLPAAVVVYGGSNYDNRPRRSAEVSIVVAAESFSDSDVITARGLVDKAVSLLDEKIINQAVFSVVSDNALDVGPGVAAYVVNFEVEDH